jgi:predicted nucleic acid-binding protein
MTAPPKSPATMPASKVVDAWAMIARLLDQAAAPAVEALIQEADAGNLQLLMSWMNVGEVYYIISKRHGPERAVDFLNRLPSLPIRLVLPDENGILAAAEVKAAHPVSFSDAFAIALAQAEKASVITGDDEIRRCAVVPVDWIGPQPPAPAQ